jgi:D-alanyl-D-alanine carboxypeptidase
MTQVMGRPCIWPDWFMSLGTCARAEQRQVWEVRQRNRSKCGRSGAISEEAIVHSIDIGSRPGQQPTEAAHGRDGHPPVRDDELRGNEHRPRRAAAAVLAVAVLITAAVTVVASPAALADAAPVTRSDARDAAADADRRDVRLHTMLRDVTAAGVPGALARVQSANGARVAAAVGVSDLATGATLRPDFRFRAGSVTKTFVATVVLQLVGEGRLKLDEPVGRRLPGLLADGDQITVRQLLNHTSGLADYTADPSVLAGTVDNRVFTPRELVAIAQALPATGPPGSAWAYSNTNYIVAGLLVEAVTGHRLGRELRERLIEPQRLDDTSFPEATARIPGSHAHGYVPGDLVPTPDGQPLDVTGLNPSAAWAAGALISNTGDLARFYRALMTGRILSPALLREMRTTVAEDPTDPTHRFRYGLGIERVQDSCGANWGHGGTTLGYQDLAYWNEQTGRTVVLAVTMWPAPPAAEAPIAALTDYALCEMPDPRR